MDKPRLSIVSSSCDDDVSEDTVSLPSPVTTQIACPPMTVESMIVNKGGTGVLHGNLTTYTLNQFIVPNPDVWDSGAVKELVTDAVKLSTATKKNFFPKDDSKLLGNKEDVEGLQRRWCYLIAVLVLLSFVTFVSTSVFSLTKMKTETNGNQTPYYSVDDNSIVPGDLPGAPRIVERAAWVAQPPASPMDNNTLPVQRVIICHTAADSCDTTPDCALKVRYVQMFHMESKKWSDIGYNFLIGGDGCVYVGRGWDYMGAHTKSYNNGTLGIAFIGTYITKMPSDLQIDAFNKLMYIGVKINKIAENYTLVAQCQLQITAAPGITLAKHMTSWPHFDSTLPIKCTSQ